MTGGDDFKIPGKPPRCCLTLACSEAAPGPGILGNRKPRKEPSGVLLVLAVSTLVVVRLRL
jgi:hypothetical protein